MRGRVVSNLEGLSELLGSLSGISESLEDDKYLAGLIRSAHHEATTAFDLAAAAAAHSGYLSHMFEFGVPGITAGQAKFADPTSAAARLWTHRISGRGRSQSIGYVFRPALVRNPRPSTARTGVRSKYIRKLSRRKYIFANKAFVIETGAPVEIRSDQRMIFVPFYGKSSNDPNNKRGFMMWDSQKFGPLTFRPGKNMRGQFTAFWLNWWGSEGKYVMDLEMGKTLEKDINVAMKTVSTSASASALKPALATNIHRAFTKSESSADKVFGTQTKSEQESFI